MTLASNQSRLCRLANSVDRGRRLARVDRAADQRHAARRRLRLARVHQRDRRQHRHRRLADRDHVRLGPQQPDEVHHVVDIVVEREVGRDHRHLARVAPVGDVDVVVGQERLDGAAQQRREVAGHRRDQQHLRPEPGVRPAPGIGPVRRAAEMHEVAPGAAFDDVLGDLHRLPVDDGVVVPELGFAEDARRVLETVEAGDRDAAHRRLPQRIERPVDQGESAMRQHAHRCQAGALHFVKMIKHAVPSRAPTIALCGNVATVARLLSAHIMRRSKTRCLRMAGLHDTSDMCAGRAGCSLFEHQAVARSRRHRAIFGRTNDHRGGGSKTESKKFQASRIGRPGSRQGSLAQAVGQSHVQVSKRTGCSFLIRTVKISPPCRHKSSTKPR